MTATATAREVAKAMRENTAPATPAPAAASPEFEMTAEDTEIHSVLAYLETVDAKHAGKADAWVAYVKKHYAYQEEWAAKNPDKEFNPEDQEHEAWYDANYPDIDEKLLDKARIDMRVDQAFNERIRPREEAQERKQLLDENLPQIAHRIAERIGSFVTMVDPEIEKILRGPDGQLDWSDASIAKVMAHDPLANEIMDEMVQTGGEVIPIGNGKTIGLGLKPLLLELEKTLLPGLGYKLNPAGNVLHARIDKYVRDAENKIAEMPSEKRTVEGRQFIPMSQYLEMRRRIFDKKVPAATKTQEFESIEAAYWTIADQPDLIKEEMVTDFAVKTKARIEKFASLSKKSPRVGTQPAPATQQTPTPAPSPSPAPAPAPAPALTARPGPVPPGMKPNAPSTAVHSDVVITAPPGGPSQKTGAQVATDSMFS